MKNRSRSKFVRGMTILEVLVALAVFSMVSVALLSAMNNQVFGLERLEQKTFATYVADNVLADLIMRGVVPAESWVTGEYEMVDRKWFYRYQTLATADAHFLALDVEVHDTKEYDDPIASLRTYIYRK